MTIPFYNSTPAPEAVFEGEILPLGKANLLAKFLYTWITPVLQVGYSRPLQAEDLWLLTDELKCQTNAQGVQDQFMKRMPPSRRFHAHGGQHSAIDEPFERPAPKRKPGGSDPSSASASPTPSYEVEKPKPIVNACESITDVTPTAAEKAAPRPSRLKLGDPDPADISKYGEKKAKKIAMGGLAIEDGQEYDMSLWKALASAYWPSWWTAACFYGIGMALRITAPLITRQLIQQLTRAHAFHQAQEDGASLEGLVPPPSVGYGIGLAFSLFLMQYMANLSIYQSGQIAEILGARIKSGLVDLIARKSMRLSGKSRIEMTNGRLITLVSSDCSIVDWAISSTVSLPIDPITILVGLGLLIYTLGYSALVGFAVLCLAIPIQGILFTRLIGYADSQEQHTDKRVRLLTEILNNVRAVKLYAYERFFADKVSDIRRDELGALRKKATTRATMVAILNVIPSIAAIMAFITYELTGHQLDAPIIFSGLQWFNVLKQPISYLPIVLASVADMMVSMRRITRALRAEELDDKMNIEQSAEFALDVKGEFMYDPAPSAKVDVKKKPEDEAGDATKTSKEKKTEAKEKKKFDQAKEKKRKKLGLSLDMDPDEDTYDGPYVLSDVNLQIPHGSLVCIVGRVGTGKSTLLLSLINEVKKVHGHVKFGGTVSYVPQQAWVQSGTVRDNITFCSGRAEIYRSRLQETIDACALRTDLDNWDDGEETKVGEKGITLSGGQRQRLCLARAAYDDSEIVLLDDPLSAVDAAVGHHLLEKCILTGPFAHRTRILVTHHLDVLPKADLVLVMDRVGDTEGRIVQKGTYDELRQQEGIFRKLVEEYGIAEKHEDPEDKDADIETSLPKDKAPRVEVAVAARSKSDRLTEPEEREAEKEKQENEPKKTGEKDVFLDEERVTGNISWGTYLAWFRALKSPTYLVLCATFLILTQVSSVGNSLFLGYWSGSSINGFSQGEYMGVYAGFGASQALFNFCTVLGIAMACMRASFNFFNGGWAAVMRSPTAWHDRTPTGRIISRLSKDVRMLDDNFSIVWYQLLSNALIILGTFGLIVYTYPWLGLMFIPLTFGFYLCIAFYTRTSRELKRVQSVVRSGWYTAFSEQLAGLSVIRAFGQQERYQQRLQEAINRESQAYVLTITCQRWLGVRLEAMSQLTILMIAIFGVVFRDKVSPDRFGVVLTHAIATSSIFTLFVALWARCEQEMNCVERVHHYNILETEAAPLLESDPSSDEWPKNGSISFKDVKLRYRPELPLVLKDLSFEVKAGEKVGIIGRTGAGKSSVAQALFRTVEVEQGEIRVDGVDLKLIGLETLRKRLAIIPQDTFLFAGTIRDNIDPTSARTDAELNDALNLIRHHPRVSATLRDKLKLDATVAPEGNNFSAGEKQLLSLIRALSRRCKVLLLDEATSSVDPETDALIQGIIQTEFSDVTLLSIAHRLQTVAYYDRVLVLEQGQVAEYDTPLALFDNPTSVFRDLCNTKHIRREGLVRIREEARLAKSAHD